MEFTVRGKIWLFGNNIDTDQIYPGRYLELVEHSEIAKHAMEGADPAFSKEFEPGGILVAGDNFGCGSSREHAVITLKNAGVSAIIANSFARIFYRNAINLGVPVITCEGALQKMAKGDSVSVDLVGGIVTDLSTGVTLQGDKLSPHVLNIIEKGGVIPLFREKFGKE
ncbi:MAG TPA: 3-isopropylmalate dehydratase small subunit [Clostridia bacterium]